LGVVVVDGEFDDGVEGERDWVCVRAVDGGVCDEGGGGVAEGVEGWYLGALERG